MPRCTSDSGAFGDNNASDVERKQGVNGVPELESRREDDHNSNNQCDPDEREDLCRVNNELRAKVDDLSSALLVRDMEIASLRERCQFLMKAVEQQDEVIAKIYASATGPLPMALPVVSGHLQPASVPSKKNGFGPKLDVESKAQTPTTLASAVAFLEPAREMLESHLDSVGFQCGRVVEALESLSEGVLTRTKEQPNDTVNAALDKLMDPTNSPPATNLFGNGPSSSSSTGSSPLSTSSDKSSRRRPAFGRQDSTPSEEDFAKSAGFLRRPVRRPSVRLTVSDFGLLGDDNNQADNLELSAKTSEDGGLEGSVPARKKQELFANIDAMEAKRKSSPSSGNLWGSEEEQDDELSYGEFLERISMPASRDILDKIRKFVRSILGPRGDGRPPRASDYADYDFYGKHEFRRRCEFFFQNMDATLQSHPAWRHVSESKLSKARDGIEKYVMDKVYDVAFNQLSECHQWKKDDDKLLRRMQLLSVSATPFGRMFMMGFVILTCLLYPQFISPDMLDIKPCMRNEVVWSMAEDELRRMNSFRSPGDKINCIVRCCSIIFSVLNLSRGDSGSRPGADDFLPVFIYIVLHSQIPRLYSNCEYIAAYRNPADLMSK